MTTPARLAQGSTPKSAAVLTPSNITSSPHASHSAPPKGFSGKSPAIKTPSSLGHGHSHNLSTSSHPASTPLAAMMSGEDPMSLSSPATAAVMAQLGSRGLTPLAGGNEGLGISSDGVSLKAISGPSTRNPEEERLQRLRQTIENLKPRVASYGICREGIENLGPIAGFSPFWQEEILTIAGDHLVDLEIEFEGAKSDRIKDVSLKIGAPGSPEAARNDAASRVLKRNLTEFSSPESDAPWQDLGAFASNLERLGNLDRLSSSLNCFKALEGLEECFVRYWNEEQRHRQNQGLLSKLSSGSIGRPILHQGNTIGLGLEFWATKKKLIEASLHRKGKSAVEKAKVPAIDCSLSFSTPIWTARIDCEGGFPPLHVSKAWIAEDPLVSTDGDSDGLGTTPLHPAWQDPRTTSPDAMTVDAPNARFVAKLDPTIHLPVMIVSSMFDQTLAGSWIQRPVRPLEVILSDSRTPKSGLADGPNWIDGRQDWTEASVSSWTKVVSSVDNTGTLKDERFEYRMKSEQNMWCYSVDDIPFEHPRQITQLFPIFRQYALLYTLLKSITSKTSDRAESKLPENRTLTSPLPRRNGFHKSNKINSKYARLDAILGKQKTPSIGSTESDTSNPRLQAIDVSLRLSSTTPQVPCIDLFLPRVLSSRTADSTSSKTCLLSIEITLNGHLMISNVENLPNVSSDPMRKKMADILDLSEDLTVLTAWVLQQKM